MLLDDEWLFQASFNVTGNRQDIDVNDPNFWQKWARKANVDPESLEKEKNLIIYEPRQRKRRFDEEMYKMSGESEIGSEDSDSDSADG